MSQEISRDELRDRLDELTLVEALPRAAFRRLHLPNAVNLPKSQVEALAPELLPDLEAEIVVYCGSWLCRSSDRVADKVGDRLPEAAGIAQHHRGNCRRHPYQKFDILL